MYTDPSVAQQASTFAINPSNVTCGVGTFANGQNSGPFAMLMYSLHIKSYDVEPKVSTIRATSAESLGLANRFLDPTKRLSKIDLPGELGK